MPTWPFQTVRAVGAFPSADLDRVRRAFVDAVIDPDTGAVLIDADNRGVGLLPVAEMAGRCAAGVVHPLVLAADLDCPDRSARVAEQIAAAASERGLVPVIEASGGSGRRHVWVRCTTSVEWADLADDVRRIAAEAGMVSPVRSGPGGRMRPPLAPHRSGSIPVLISPVSVDEAIAALSGSNMPGPERVAAVASSNPSMVSVFPDRPALGAERVLRLLSPRMRAVVLDGAAGAPGEYLNEQSEVDGSRVARAVAVAVARVGGNQADLIELFADEHHAAGASYRKRLHGWETTTSGRNRTRAGSEQSARAWISRVWPDLSVLPAPDGELRQGPVGDPEASAQVRQAVDDLRRVAAGWTHRQAPADLLSVGYVCWKALAQNTLTPPVSVREWAEHTGLSRSGVAASQQRLLDELGVLQVAGRPRGEVTTKRGQPSMEATLWRLVPQPSMSTDASEQDTGGTPPAGGARCASTRTRPLIEPGSDAACALGKRGQQILSLLQERPHTIDALLDRCGLNDPRAMLRSRTTTRPRGGPLRMLLDSGLVEQHGDNYQLATTIPADATDRLVQLVAQHRPAIDGRRQRIEQRHDHERQQFAEWRTDTQPQRLQRQRQHIEHYYNTRHAGTPRSQAGAIIAHRWAHRHGLTEPHPIDTKRRADRERRRQRRARQRHAHPRRQTTPAHPRPVRPSGPRVGMVSAAEAVQLTLTSLGLNH